MANIGHAVNPSLYRSLPFDPVRDFSPIILVATQPSLLVANLSFPAKSVRELIALAKAHPGTIHFATAGNGTGSHLSGELFKIMAGVEIVHVPYKGSPPATNDLLGGHVPLMIDGLPSALPHVRAGKSRALGITTAKRSPAAPDIPTIAEQGLDGYESNGWNGLLAPAAIAASKKVMLDTLAVAWRQTRAARQPYWPSRVGRAALRKARRMDDGMHKTKLAECFGSGVKPLDPACYRALEERVSRLEFLPAMNKLFEDVATADAR